MSVCLCVCVCASVLEVAGGLQKQMLLFSPNKLVRIFMSCTRPQLDYRWKTGKGEGGEGVRGVRPLGNKPCV